MLSLLGGAALAGCATAEAQGDRAGGLPERAPSAEAAPSPGAPLPAVALAGLDAQPVRLEAAAGGKPALVSFWATWCDACLAELDALNRLDDRARAGGGVVIGVAVGETRAAAAAFARQHGLRYLQLVDEKLSLADALGQRRLPATLVLDRQGRVIFTGAGLDERALAAFRAAMSR
jgi:peroxiredoxin